MCILIQDNYNPNREHQRIVHSVETFRRIILYKIMKLDNDFIIEDSEKFKNRKIEINTEKLKGMPPYQQNKYIYETSKNQLNQEYDLYYSILFVARQLPYDIVKNLTGKEQSNYLEQS